MRTRFQCASGVMSSPFHVSSPCFHAHLPAQTVRAIYAHAYSTFLKVSARATVFFLPCFLFANTEHRPVSLLPRQTSRPGNHSPVLCLDSFVRPYLFESKRAKMWRGRTIVNVCLRSSCLKSYPWRLDSGVLSKRDYLVFAKAHLYGGIKSYIH